MPITTTRKAVHFGFGPRRVFARQPGRCRRLEQQIEFGVVPVTAFALESQFRAHCARFAGGRQGQVHGRRRVASRGVELECAAANQHRHDVVLGQLPGEQPQGKQTSPTQVRLGSQQAERIGGLVPVHGFIILASGFEERSAPCPVRPRASGWRPRCGVRAATYYLTWILQRVNQHLRLAMMDAAHLSLREHQQRKVGDAIYRAYQDSAMVTAVVQNALIEPAVALGNLVVALAAVALFDPYLGLLFLLAALPSLVAAKVLTPRLRRQSAAARAANSDLTSHIQESTAAARLLQANGAEAAAFGVFRSRSRTALDRAYELRRSVAVLSLLVFLCTATAAIGADYLMVAWVWQEAPTFGFGFLALVGFAVWNLGAFQAARERSVSLSAAAVSLAAMWSLLQDMGMGLGRAFVLLDIEPEVADPPQPEPMPAVRRGVAFDNVRFSYGDPEAGGDDAEREVLRGVTFHAAPGTTTAIVGASGATRRTLGACGRVSRRAWPTALPELELRPQVLRARSVASWPRKAPRDQRRSCQWRTGRRPGLPAASRALSGRKTLASH